MSPEKTTAKAATTKAGKAPKADAAEKKPARSRSAAPKAAEATATAEPKTNGRSTTGFTKPVYAGLRQRYHDDVVPALQREFTYANSMQIPRVEKVVVNIGLGEAIANAKALDAAVGDLTTITGQKPIVTRAKKSVANFRLRAGMPVGVKVTLRGEKMWSFLDRLMNVALPRQRDFRGISPDSFDGRGNYTLGLTEQLIFPEIDYDTIDRLRGMEITIVTSAQTDEEGRRLLTLLGMPFKTRTTGG